MPRESIPIQTLLLRVFLPAVAVIAIGLGLLTYDRLYRTILDGFDRKLITTSALTGALIDARDHDKLIAIARTEPKGSDAERMPEYIRAVLPMRQIREQLGLTYLYTQILGGKKDIIYVVDSTVGGQHSQIGSEDVLPPGTLAGIRRAQQRMGIYLSAIEFQEQWGLLKTAAAPVLSESGKIVATAGADVNVSLIRIATQNALFASVVIGMASLVACTSTILLIVRRVAQPLDRLRQEALRIAGGDHSPLMEFPAPRDIATLQQALAESTSEMTGRLADRRQAAKISAEEAGIIALDFELAKMSGGSAQLRFSGSYVDDTDALLRRVAATRLAERIAAGIYIPDHPILPLAKGERATVTLADGRTVLIGEGR